MTEYLIKEEQMKELADIIREKFGLVDYEEAALMLVSGDRSSVVLSSLPEGLTSIRSYAFNDCANLALTSLPNGVTDIGNWAFAYCHNLALTSLPEGLTRIGSSAFLECTNLSTITFKSTPTTIDETAFSFCSNLTTINVPWSEGAVAGAPWGATNATINYNFGG